MNVYIYQAALYCPDCTRTIRARLDAEGKRPAGDVDDESGFDSDDYPKGPSLDGGGEADAPQHCDACKCHLENPLTRDGEAYVVESLKDYVTGDANGDPAVLDLWASFYSDTIHRDSEVFVVKAYRAVRTVERDLEALKATPCKYDSLT